MECVEAEYLQTEHFIIVEKIPIPMKQSSLKQIMSTLNRSQVASLN